MTKTTNLPQKRDRWSRFQVRRAATLLVWLGSVAALLYLSRRTTLVTPIPGHAEASRFTVVAPVEGKLRDLAVDLNDTVTAGQVLARLSDEDVQIRLTKAKLELQRLRADLERRSQELEFRDRAMLAKQTFEATVEVRRCQDDIESARLDELQTKTEIEEARVRMQGVAVEASRLGTLGREIASDSALVRLETERDALSKRIAELGALLTAQGQRVDAARERLAKASSSAVPGLSHDVVLEPLRLAIKAQDAQLERIAGDAAKLTLIAPEGGRVESVRVRAGEWVPQGGVVLTIVEPKVRRILAYVPESLRTRVDKASVVDVTREGRPGSVRRSTVLGISPAPVPVPKQLWRLPQVEEWAFQLVVSVAGDEIPGERISLVLRP